MTVIQDKPQPAGASASGGSASIPSGNSRTTVIAPKRGLADLGFAEILAYKDLLYTLALRDVKLRYRQTALGVIWVVVQPVMAAIIFTLIFGIIGKGRFSSDGVASFPFIFAGQMIWSAINNTVMRTTNSLLGNAGLVSKIYFPRLILPISNIGSVFIDFGVSFVVLMICMLFYGIHITPAVILMPFFLLLVGLAATGIGLFTAALVVSYRDIAYILPIVMQFVMYASPINYSSNKLPAGLPAFVPILFAINPVTTLVNGLRWTLLGTPAPSILSIFTITLVSFGMFFVGALLFRSMEKRFADVI